MNKFGQGFMTPKEVFNYRQGLMDSGMTEIEANGKACRVRDLALTEEDQRIYNKTWHKQDQKKAQDKEVEELTSGLYGPSMPKRR
jgi:hypothetical protein